MNRFEIAGLESVSEDQAKAVNGGGFLGSFLAAEATFVAKWALKYFFNVTI